MIKVLAISKIGTLLHVVAADGIFQQASIACQIHLNQTAIAAFSILDTILLPTPCQALLNTRSKCWESEI